MGPQPDTPGSLAGSPGKPSRATVPRKSLCWGRPFAPFFLGGALFYLVGAFLVTGLGNVPLNDQLAAVSATDPAALDVWQHYLSRWTTWNHVRTAAAMVAALLYTLGLMQNGST